MFQECLEEVRKKTPLVHNITNYVTVNDCANILLACKASPIMADDVEEVEEITAICSGLNLNIGTLNQRTIQAMKLAGKKAGQLGHPILLDPVGAGASALRTRTARELLEDLKISAVRGNSSEIKTLALGTGATRGVDADISDRITEDSLEKAAAFAKAFSKKTGAVIAITGAIDIVADEEKAFCIFNGHPMMSSITGTGCQLSAMMTAYICANPDRRTEAAAAAVAAMGVCGEKAYESLTVQDGNTAYRSRIIDQVFHLTGEELEKRAKYKLL
ncbi:hydroxyethylthiazole kinase [Suipraeoptans intestinalis]|uniref:hydroxyethylthiazole kinase n=1 Tax=Suipraeoptans intestinalis TaxID=2606628 RepID=UPI002A7660C5|nr:hydroxyethylthiazole kinase [Suipraeoptans intestinalis]MDY3121988.1 hydroxyethylthiazole kinase [Suipraeoptans intestinalis]